MGCRPGPIVWTALVGALLLALTVPLGSADSVSSSATIRNATPQILAVDIVLDARHGAFVYDVTAEDLNGAPDLDRAVFHFLDAEDRIYSHRDDRPLRNGAQARWTGVATAGAAIVDGPFRVHLHVYDRHDAETHAELPVTVLGRMVEDVDDASDVAKASPGPSRAPLQRAFALLGDTSGPIEPSEIGWIGLGGIALLGTVGASWATTRHEGRQRR